MVAVAEERYRNQGKDPSRGQSYMFRHFDHIIAFIALQPTISTHMNDINNIT
jgi:hypothetical protein